MLHVVPCSGLAGRAAGAAAALSPGDHTFSLQHQERNRAYIVHVPGAATTGRPLPVVLAFHGGGGEAQGFKGYAGLDTVADREGFIVVYPNGTGVLPRRLLTWNAGECCGYAMNQRVDDVGLAIAVLDDVARRTAVDARRVYATGHSNGAVIRTGSAPSAPTASPRSRLSRDRTTSASSHQAVPLPSSTSIVSTILEPCNGGLGPPFPGTNVRASHRPVMEGIERWRRFNGCSEQVRDARNAQGIGTLWRGGADGGAARVGWMREGRQRRALEARRRWPRMAGEQTN